MNNEEKIKVLFDTLKKAHGFYVSGSFDFKKRIELACLTVFDQLEQLGVARHFSEALLFFGHEFVESLDEGDLKNAQIIFGVKVQERDELTQKEFNLAQKHKALAYEPVKTSEGRASIRVLTYLKH